MQGKNNITIESLSSSFDVTFNMMGYMTSLHGQRIEMKLRF